MQLCEYRTMYLPSLQLKGIFCFFFWSKYSLNILVHPLSEHIDMSLRAANLGVEWLCYQVCTHLPLLDTEHFSKWFYEGSVGYGAYEV